MVYEELWVEGVVDLGKDVSVGVRECGRWLGIAVVVYAVGLE